MLNNKIVEKIYAGFLGMNIGIRLGAPVEPTIWTYERIRDTYGDITDYVKEYKNFAADDDANGPVYFLRALYDKKGPDLSAQDVADAWLNYAREGVGMFWWGGYGRSTEHTAYLNLKNGIPAPESGSIAQNGEIMAEQIGGQIFIDTWGLINPGNPHRAAEMGAKAASVSHDRNGIYGARFMCACIARAFVAEAVEDVIEAGLEEIPSNSTYSRVVRAVIDFYEKDLDKDWRKCHQFLVEEWGYDRYGGVCHIIPNAGVCALALMYGQGDFSRTIEIATMCAWDTDCNASNVGTILGVLTGLDGIPAHYRDPINDGIVLSGISGYLNNLDIPSYVKELAAFACELEGQEVPQALKPRLGEIDFDFNLPGSTHNLRVSDPFFCKLEHSTEKVKTGSGSLKILFDRMTRGQQCKVFYKPFYRRDAFSDERYMPVFSPTCYPGQEVEIVLYLDQWNGWETMGIAPYVRSAHDKKDHLQGYIKLENEKWQTIKFTIPDLDGDVVDEVGLVLEGYSISKAKSLGVIYMDSFKVSGKACYGIDFSKQSMELGTVTPFSVDGGAWDILGDEVQLMNLNPAWAYGGNYYAKDYKISAEVEMYNHAGKFLAIRAQGARRGYLAGFDTHDKAVLYVNDSGLEKLAEVDFKTENNKKYKLELEAVGDVISFYVDDRLALQVSDKRFDNGMYGIGALHSGRGSFRNIRYQDL
jgi:ADP-ribosylglycohydrolase